MVDIVALIDEAAAVYHGLKLKPSAAVWSVFRRHGIADRPDAKGLARKILAKLGRRGAARRKKENEREKCVLQDMFETAEARGGDPED